MRNTPTAQKIISHAKALGFQTRPGTIAGVNETTFYVFDGAGKFICDVYQTAAMEGRRRRTIITISGGHTTDLRGILHIMTNRAGGLPECKRCGGEVRPDVTNPSHLNNPDAVCGPRYCHYALSN